MKVEMVERHMVRREIIKTRTKMTGWTNLKSAKPKQDEKRRQAISDIETDEGTVSMEGL
jgi:hypothetical protein